MGINMDTLPVSFIVGDQHFPSAFSKSENPEVGNILRFSADEVSTLSPVFCINDNRGSEH